MFAALLPLLGGIGSQIAKNLFPDPADETKRQEIETQFQAQIVANAAEIEKAAAGIINTEAASKHWLAANWRPLTMLVFVGLIVSRWLGYSAENMTEAEYLSVYDLVKIGLGGYVVGRSAEKIVPKIIDAKRK
tara:strand:+ start:1060 stop:1458 length:399 start_codon:yes stop_codon:yes gene_type:complete